MEESKLKNNTHCFEESLDERNLSFETKDLLVQFEAMQSELEKKKEECKQLKAILADKHLPIPPTATGGQMGVSTIEDSEIFRSFDSCNADIKLIKEDTERAELELRDDIESLLEDNERLKGLMSQNLKETFQDGSEPNFQKEINRLTNKNLVLMDQNNKLKKQLKVLAKKVQDTAVVTFSNITPHSVEPFVGLERKVYPNLITLDKQKNVEYLGMFEYKKEDERVIIHKLIYDLRPRVALTLVPGLPAYIIFMCVRHVDLTNDEDKVRTLLNRTIYGIKKVIKKRHQDLDYCTLWLTNTCRLLHNLEQYSGDKVFQTENTPKQMKQCLKNFDLSEYRQILRDVVDWIYQVVVKLMKKRIQPFIVPAILENIAIESQIRNKPFVAKSSLSSGVRDKNSSTNAKTALNSLFYEMDIFYNVLTDNGVDPELICQLYKQVFYFITAGSFNDLVFRKDMCHWSKSKQIRQNFSLLEQWFKKLQDRYYKRDCGVIKILAPIVQASELLGVRKTEDNVQSIIDICENLTTSQIITIINLNTPADETEKVCVSFIRNVHASLQKRDKERLLEGQQPGLEPSTLLMDTESVLPIEIPFNSSNIQLEEIVIPDILNLNHFLRKV